MSGILPKDSSVPDMLEWIASKYNMNKADLARMFQTTPPTIYHWLKNGRVSHKNFMKIRASYYYLHNSKDPHTNERKCLDCKKWLALAGFRKGKAICRNCENKKTLGYYWNNRKEQLKKRKVKNWYNKRRKIS